jgi:hypothetical protein
VVLTLLFLGSYFRSGFIINLRDIQESG